MRLKEAFATAARCGSRAETHTPYPYMRCYCSICRAQGGGGYATSWAKRRRQRARRRQPGQSCAHQGAGDKRKRLAGAPASLRAAAARWGQTRRPEWVHPFASAIDTRRLPLEEAC
jgi:hypothetical protein